MTRGSPIHRCHLRLRGRSFRLTSAGIASLLVVGICIFGCAPDPAALNANLLEASKMGDAARIEALLKQGAAVESHNQSGRTAVALAALKGNRSAVESLLAARANPNARDSAGMTPLMWAAFGGSEEVVRALLAHGADATLRDTAGETALDWARKSNARVRDLLQRSAGGSHR